MRSFIIGLMYCCLFASACTNPTTNHHEEIHKTDTLVNSLYQKGNQLQLSKPDSAVALFKRCAREYKTMDSADRVMDCYCKLAHIYSFFLNDLKRAQQYTDSAGILAQNVDSLQYKSLYAQGICKLKEEDYDSAAILLLDALNISNQKKDTLNSVTISGLISHLFFTQKKYKLALEYYQPILAKAEKRAGTNHDVIAFINAYCYANQIPDKGSAAKYLQKALSMAHKINDSSLYTILYYNIGMYYKDVRQFDSALHFTRLAINHISPNTPALLKPEKPYLLNTEVYIAQQRYVEASEQFELVLNKTDTAELESNDKEFYYNMGYLIFEHFNDRDKELFYLKKFIQLQEKRHEIELSDQLLDFEKEIKKLAAEKTILKKDSEIRKQKNFTYLLTAGLVILTLIIIIIITEIRKRRKLQAIEYLYRLQEADLEKKRAVLQMQIEERSRIAKEMHDDLGSSLTTMYMGMELVQQEPGNSKHMSLLNQATEKLSGQINEVIWNLNMRNDFLYSLVDYFRQHAAEFLGNAGIEFRLNSESIKQDIPLPGIYRRAIYLTLKELLNNIVKYAGAGQVVITFSLEAGYLRIIVKDNGKGINAAAKKTAGPGHGNGLKNIVETITQLGGSICWNENKGTETTIQIPLQP